MNSELTEKTQRLSAMLERTGFDGVFLTLQHNFAWLTGGRSNGVDLSRDAGATSLLVASDGRRFVFANAIEMPRMLAEEVAADDFEPRPRWEAKRRSGRSHGELPSSYRAIAILLVVQPLCCALPPAGHTGRYQL